MAGLGIRIPHKKLEEFCRRNHIKRMAFFGSVLRADFRPDSDIDILVEFEPGHTPGLAFFGMQEELKLILGRDVDLNTFNGVKSSRNYLFRDAVLGTAREIYASR